MQAILMIKVSDPCSIGERAAGRFLTGTGLRPRFDKLQNGGSVPRTQGLESLLIFNQKIFERGDARRMRTEAGWRESSIEFAKVTNECFASNVMFTLESKCGPFCLIGSEVRVHFSRAGTKFLESTTISEPYSSGLKETLRGH